MNWWQRLRQRDRLERELVAELEDYVARQVADLVASGVPEAEARRRAKLALGPDKTAEACRDVRGTRWLEELGQDLRYGWRDLRQKPAFAAVAVLSLALGIGANSALFTIVDSLIRRSLPVREPERLLLLDHGPWSNPIWEEMRDRHDGLFDGMFACATTQFDLAAGGEERPVQGLWVSGSFFDVLGVPAQLGRTISARDDVRGGGANGPVVVISDGFWWRHFGGAPDVVGRTLRLDRVFFTIVGVTPPGFFGPEVGNSFDVALPIGVLPMVRPTQRVLDHRSMQWLGIGARLKPGQTAAEATAALRAVQAQIREATLPTDWQPNELAEYLSDKFELVAVRTGVSPLRERYQRPLLTIFAVSALVLLVACANIANLLMARGSERRREFSMRQALGASRSRVARQLLTESLLLSALGAALGFVFARWGSRLLVQRLSASGRVTLDLPLDWRVLLFTAATAVGTALLFGTLPALRACRADPNEVLKEHGRGRRGLFGRTVGGPLLVTQVALSLVLLAAAGFFLRTLSSIANRNLGFQSEGVLLVSLDAGRSGIPSESLPAFFERLRESVEDVPGVVSVGLSEVTPVSGSTWSEQFVSEGRLREKVKTFAHAITPGWLGVYGTHLVAGRDVSFADRPEAPPVALVNQEFARRVFGSANALGRTIDSTGNYLPPMEVVGVVEDAVYRNVREESSPTIYVPYAQAMKGEELPPYSSLSVRTSVDSPSRLAPEVAAAIARVDSKVSLRFRSLADQVRSTLVRERLIAVVSGFFGALALLLAAIGLYGMTHHAVERRRAEIGVRMALGADAKRVVRLMLGRVAGLVLIGALAGGAISIWASRFVTALLYGLKPGDPLTIAGAGVLLVGITLLAAYLPARRAARIDPATVLREG